MSLEKLRSSVLTYQNGLLHCGKQASKRKPDGISVGEGLTLTDEGKWGGTCKHRQQGRRRYVPCMGQTTPLCACCAPLAARARMRFGYVHIRCAACARSAPLPHPLQLLGTALLPGSRGRGSSCASDHTCGRRPKGRRLHEHSACHHNLLRHSLVGRPSLSLV